MLRVVGRNHDILSQGSACIARRRDLYGDFSLSTGRDLPRVGGSRAASAGFNAGDMQGGGTLVMDDKIVRYRLAGWNIFKLIAFIRYIQFR